MFEDRHKQTRTYGTKGSGTKSTAIGKIRDKLTDLPANASDKQARKAAGEVVKGELSKDHEVVRDIYRQSRLSQKTKDRVESGLRRVWSLDRSEYFVAFEE
jgi:hypothetical protein